MLRKVLKTIKKNNMLKAGDKVVCALSGGADSMALLCALYELKDDLGILLCAAHMNHSIRGADADADEKFAADFCKSLGVEIFTKKVNVPLIAKETGISEEECGRYERYRFFNQVCENVGGALIATGHHKNDNAETVLFNLFRGSGSRGLGGIAYKRDNIIRPLLDVTRADTENYLMQKNIAWREDKTNFQCEYTRNKIRLVILKDIEKCFPEAVEKIALCSEAVRTDDEYLQQIAENSGAFENGCIYEEKFANLHESIRRRVIINALKEWGLSPDRERINAVYSIVTGPTGKYRDLGKGVRVVNNYGSVSLLEKSSFCPEDVTYNIKSGESLEIKVFEGSWSIKTVDKSQKIRDNKMMILLDADKLGDEVSVRCRKDGDYISPLGMDGKKKLKKVFIDLKIPKEKRDRISMLAYKDEILFIPGIRKTKNYLPDNNTKKFLVAEYKG